MLEKIINIWISGGWVMFPLCILAIAIYCLGFDMLLYLKKNNIKLVKGWKSWIQNPKDAPPDISEIIIYSQENVSASKQLRQRFEEINNSLLGEIDRKLIFLNTLVASAPLMGLLGTVIGMLGTFSAISSGGGSETVDMVAAGISEALITTQTGLFIALPGIFLILIINRKKSAIKSAILRLESYTLTSLKLT